MSLLHLGSVPFSKPANPALLQHSDASPVCNPVTPISSQSPHTAIKNEPMVPGYTDSPSAWQQSAPALGKLAGSTDMAGYGMDGRLPNDVSAMAYPTPSQSMPLKASSIGGNPLNPAYDNTSLMLDSSALAAQPSSGISSAFAAPLHGMLPPSSSFSEFATAAPTPLGGHPSANSSPMSMHNSLANHSNLSPASMMPATGLHSLSDIPPISASMMAPGTRPLEVLGSGTVIESTMSLSHELSSGASMHTSAHAGHDTSIEDRSLDHIVYWGEDNFVCIPSVHNLLVQLNSLGMTAHHVDSVHKNFNDYQFKRRTDQRRIRHTSEQGITKFSHESFLPGRPDLLHLVVRKSALKKMQGGGSGGRDRVSGSARKKPRAPSLRQNGTRPSRQSTSERINPYARYAPVGPEHISGFPMPMSPTTSFQTHQGPSSSAVPPLYSASETSGLVMPLGVPNFGFGISHTMPMPERSEPGLISTSSSGYSQAPFYMNNASPGFIPTLMQPPHVSLPSSFQGQYPTPLPPPHQQTHHTPHTQPLQHEYKEHSPRDSAEDHYHGHNPLALHPPHMQQPHQYQLFASSGDMAAHPTPPRGVDSGSHLA
ncbi:hypothetical protein LPJ63_000544 [Coemansia sp. RSA 2711]|nr:hypothetical protein LPJ63_000544 [Coemansia sp. RSA 2711]